MWAALPLVDLQLPLIYCLLFGALISPTDPIAVISILKSAHAPKELELVIAGESLFNDGVAVVIFSLLLGMLASGTPPTVDQALQLLAHEAGGGVLFGLALGYVLFRMLKSVDSYEVEVLLTLAAVMGGYVLASKLHVSGPLAMVVVGLIDRQPGPCPGDVGHDAPLPRHVLGTARSDPQRRAVRPDGHGGAARHASGSANGSAWRWPWP